MSNVYVATMSALAFFITMGGAWATGQSMIDRPIVSAALAGLLLGDLRTGILIGGSLETVFMGAVIIDGASTAEPCSAAIMAVAFSIQGGLTLEEAVTFAVPVGLVMNNVNRPLMMTGYFWTPYFEKAIRSGDTKSMPIIIGTRWFASYALKALVVFGCVVIGAEAVQALIDKIPTWLMNGFNATNGMISAVGMAVLMKMLINAENIGWFFVGFILNKYLGLQAIPIAIIAVTIAAAIGMLDNRINDVKNLGAGADEEEEFFQ